MTLHLQRQLCVYDEFPRRYQGRAFCIEECIGSDAVNASLGTLLDVSDSTAREQQWGTVSPIMVNNVNHQPFTINESKQVESICLFHEDVWNDSSFILILSFCSEDLYLIQMAGVLSINSTEEEFNSPQ